MTHVQAGLCVAPQSALHCCVRDGVRSDIFRPQAPSAHQRARPSSSLLPSIYVLYTLRTFPEPPLLRECSCGSDAWRTRRSVGFNRAQVPREPRAIPYRYGVHLDPRSRIRISFQVLGLRGPWYPRLDTESRSSTIRMTLSQVPYLFMIHDNLYFCRIFNEFINHWARRS